MHVLTAISIAWPPRSEAVCRSEVNQRVSDYQGLWNVNGLPRALVKEGRIQHAKVVGRAARFDLQVSRLFKAENVRSGLGVQMGLGLLCSS
jgi:hypothetical protein